MKTFLFTFAGLFAIVGFNMWLVERDKKLFEVYQDKQAALRRLQRPPSASLNYFCSNQAGWHPDCPREK